MAIYGGPDIIEDGLVLHLDAAEPLCFRGEPTTNLLPYSNGVNANRVSWPYGAYSHSVETIGDFAGWEKIIATTTGEISNYVMRLGDASCTANTQYTASIEFYSPYSNLEFLVGGNQAFGANTRIGSSNRYYKTFTKNATTASQGWYLKTIATTSPYTAISNGVIYYRRAQFEQKPYYTDFTIGTRGSTVATGGGLLDLTNNGNNGTITRAAVPSAAFYTNDNKGSLVFNGSNDVVNLTTPIINRSNGQEITVSCWINPSRTSGQYSVFCTNRSDNLATFNWIFYQHTTDGAISFHGSSQYKSSYVPTTNVWVNATNTVTSSGVSTLYINGASVFTVTGYTYGSGAPSRLGIGADPGGQEPFQGKIAQVSIYNKALSANEILQNYNATKGRFGL